MTARRLVDIRRPDSPKMRQILNKIAFLCKQVYRKPEVSSRTEVVLKPKAIRLGLIEPRAMLRPHDGAPCLPDRRYPRA